MLTKSISNKSTLITGYRLIGNVTISVPGFFGRFAQISLINSSLHSNLFYFSLTSHKPYIGLRFFKRKAGALWKKKSTGLKYKVVDIKKRDCWILQGPICKAPNPWAILPARANGYRPLTGQAVQGRTGLLCHSYVGLHGSGRVPPQLLQRVIFSKPN